MNENHQEEAEGDYENQPDRGYEEYDNAQYDQGDSDQELGDVEQTEQDGDEGQDQEEYD